MANITNYQNADVNAGGMTWRPGETKPIAAPSQGIIDAVEQGSLYSDIDLTPLAGLSALTNGMTGTYTNSTGGTPIAAVANVKTFPTISDAPTANAVATILVELALARTAISAANARIAALESQLNLSAS